MTPRDALLAAVRGLPPNEPVTVPACWLQSILATPDASVPIDLTAARVGELMGRSAITVRSWCKAGLLPGAYQLFGKEWRIPAAALAVFQQQQGADAPKES